MDEMTQYENLENLTDEELALVEEEEPIPEGPGAYKGPKVNLWDLVDKYPGGEA